MSDFDRIFLNTIALEGQSVNITEKKEMYEFEAYKLVYNPDNDIRGARENINAITFQKLHKGIKLGEDLNAPDVSFTSYKKLLDFIKTIN